MATVDHSPHGRGYHTSMHYFHHANDYWSGAVGSCSAGPPPPPGPQERCPGNYQRATCLGASPELKGTSENTANADECCKRCAENEQCMGWAWGKTATISGNHSCHLKAQVARNTNDGNCTSACKFTGCLRKNAAAVVDLWLSDGMHEGPARGWNNTCNGSTSGPSARSGTPGGHPDSCSNGPLGQHWYGGYEDSIFEQNVLSTVEAHDPSDPLFLFWAPHIVHAPLQVYVTFNLNFHRFHHFELDLRGYTQP